MKFPEQYRILKAFKDIPGTKPGDPFGLFICPNQPAGERSMKMIACDGKETDWEHVSVSLCDYPKRTPSWREMCFVKSLFWDEEEWVVQFHPAKSQYVDNHPGCLHLWRCVSDFMPTPPSSLVGFKEDQTTK